MKWWPEPSVRSAVLKKVPWSGDFTLRHLTAEQSRAARALLKWSRVRLGAKSNLSEETIREFENGHRMPGPGNLARIRQALEAAGVVFTSGEPSLTNLSEGAANALEGR